MLPNPPTFCAKPAFILLPPAGWLRDLYTHQQDSNLITAEHTAALLKQLQRAMQSLPASSQSTAQANIAKPVLSPTLVTASVTSLPAAAAAASVQQHLELLSAYQSSLTVNPSSISSSSSSSSSSSTSSNPATDLQPFIAAACDVLSYLRHKQSQALLPMLRDYSSSGSKGLAAVASNPAVLRQEVQQLLQPASLQQWYVEAARSRVDAGARPTVRESTAVVLVSRLHAMTALSCGSAEPLSYGSYVCADVGLPWYQMLISSVKSLTMQCFTA